MGVRKGYRKGLPMARRRCILRASARDIAGEGRKMESCGHKTHLGNGKLVLCKVSPFHVHNRTTRIEQVDCPECLRLNAKRDHCDHAVTNENCPHYS